MSKVDHKATRQAMTEQAAAFIANPAGWPAAMAARALRLRSGHPAYSPNNHALIVCQLWGRFAAEGLSDEAAFDAAIRAAAPPALRGACRAPGRLRRTLSPTAANYRGHEASSTIHRTRSS